MKSGNRRKKQGCRGAGVQGRFINISFILACCKLPFGYLQPLAFILAFGKGKALQPLAFILAFGKGKALQPLAFILYLTSYPSPVAAQNPSCQTQDVKTLTADLLQDLPSYANRVSQRARRLSRSNDVYSYMLVAGQPEFAPLTLGPGVYTPTSPPAESQSVQQVFFTTLERRYTDGKPIELQDFHWLFLTKTESGWRLATMFTQTGGYPAKKPPTPARESSDGVIGQAIETWLRDCRMETKRNDE